MPAAPRFFDDFSLVRFLSKAVLLYLGLLGFGTAFADWSNLVSSIRDQVKADGLTVFYGFGAWLALLGAYELLRMKLRYDLQMSRIENRAARLASRKKR